MIVWLASYPRSGNTFLRVVLNNIFNIKTYSVYDDKEDIGEDLKTENIVGHKYLPEDFDLSNARNEKKAYFIKTHELPDTRVSDSDKVIYLVRDGRESSISFVKYIANYGSTKKTLMDVLSGNTFAGIWGEHVEEWSRLNKTNYMLIKFEELIASTEDQIKLLSEFLDIKVTNDFLPSFQDLQEINPKFFSSGKTSSWSDVFTKEENTLFWLKNYTQMKKLGYMYCMPEVFESEENIQLFRALSDENRYILKLHLQQIKLHDSLRIENEALQGEIIDRGEKLNETRMELADVKRKLDESINELTNVYTSRRWKVVNYLLRIQK